MPLKKAIDCSGDKTPDLTKSKKNSKGKSQPTKKGKSKPIKKCHTAESKPFIPYTLSLNTNTKLTKKKNLTVKFKEMDDSSILKIFLKNHLKCSRNHSVMNYNTSKLFDPVKKEKEEGELIEMNVFGLSRQPEKKISDLSFEKSVDNATFKKATLPKILLNGQPLNLQKEKEEGELIEMTVLGLSRQPEIKISDLSFEKSVDNATFGKATLPKILLNGQPLNLQNKIETIKINKVVNETALLKVSSMQIYMNKRNSDKSCKFLKINFPLATKKLSKEPLKEDSDNQPEFQETIKNCNSSQCLFNVETITVNKVVPDCEYATKETNINVQPLNELNDTSIYNAQNTKVHQIVEEREISTKLDLEYEIENKKNIIEPEDVTTQVEKICVIPSIGKYYSGQKVSMGIYNQSKGRPSADHILKPFVANLQFDMFTPSTSSPVLKKKCNENSSYFEDELDKKVELTKNINTWLESKPEHSEMMKIRRGKTDEYPFASLANMKSMTLEEIIQLSNIEFGNERANKNDFKVPPRSSVFKYPEYKKNKQAVLDEVERFNKSTSSIATFTFPIHDEPNVTKKILSSRFKVKKEYNAESNDITFQKKGNFENNLSKRIQSHHIKQRLAKRTQCNDDMSRWNEENTFPLSTPTSTSSTRSRHVHHSIEEQYKPPPRYQNNSSVTRSSDAETDFKPKTDAMWQREEVPDENVYWYTKSENRVELPQISEGYGFSIFRGRNLLNEYGDDKLIILNPPDLSPRDDIASIIQDASNAIVNKFHFLSTYGEKKTNRKKK